MGPLIVNYTLINALKSLGQDDLQSLLTWGRPNFDVPDNVACSRLISQSNFWEASPCCLSCANSAVWPHGDPHLDYNKPVSTLTQVGSSVWFTHSWGSSRAPITDHQWEAPEPVVA